MAAPLRLFVVRMDLYRQRCSGIDEFEQQWELIAAQRITDEFAFVNATGDRCRTMRQIAHQPHFGYGRIGRRARQMRKTSPPPHGGGKLRHQF